MRRRKIEVWWEDHHERDGQGEPLTAQNLQPMIWKSSGYLILETDSMLEIARDISEDKEVTDVGASLRIIKKNIVKRSDKKGGILHSRTQKGATA